jgi:CDP-diacylglycerol--glycerol-3-phosphate 3-phosphatidyltransferase
VQKLNRQQIMSLPNGVTILRILAIPLILVLLSCISPESQLLAALLFLGAAVTDTFDGYLARRRGLETSLGKFLDPLADKLLIATTLIALIPAREIPAWMVIAIVGREIAITGLRGIAVTQDMIISASNLGKYKTAFEMTSIFFLILNGRYFSASFYTVGMVFLWVAMVIAVISGVDYLRKYLKSIII